ncbi:serine/threonine-protein kinase [Pendulispora albinea]|uniref:Serine/threonine protein kinase n=1 Tax=Pendulispora albinea TaxID=2741071 RepID=A0ABZ2M051_9BACT
MRKIPSIPPLRGRSKPPPLPSVGGSSSARPAELPRAGTYELLLDLASGGMATVFLARALGAGPDTPLVAIKRPHRHLAKDKRFLSMLLDEARLASAIDHPNVVKVRELAFEQGEPFIVLDYVEGASLSELRKELSAAERALDTRVAVRIVLDALAGLHAAHELTDPTGRPLGIIHRDVSPHNVLLGSDGRVRLTDFGIAKAEDRMQETRTHEVKGKLAYLAPERIDRRRTCTKQSDIFSMAVVLWECLAGRRLFRGEEALDTLHEVMEAPIPRLRQLGADVPLALDEAIARGLSRDLASRYATAADFAEAIERAAGPANVGTCADVARVMAAVFGSSLRHRHQEIRTVLGSDEMANRLLMATGITPRTAPPPGTPRTNPALYAAVAPPAPSERYAYGNVRDILPSGRGRKRSWKTIGAIAVGGIVGGVGVLTLFSSLRAPRDPEASPSTVLPSSSPPSSPSSPSSPPSPTPSPTPLPEPAMIPSAAMGAAPAGSLEANRLASDSESLELPLSADDLPASPPSSSSTPSAGTKPAHEGSKPRPGHPPQVGTKRNGFTKLK